jgi:glucoamylase
VTSDAFFFVQSIPWCYYGAQSCSPLIFGSNDTSVAPFSDAEHDLMRSYFIANLDYGGNGAVLASPDGNVLGGQGGSYRYHWSRDGALSMRALWQTFVPGVVNSSLVGPYMMQYIKFVLRAHSQNDPFGESILTEPKFFLNNSVYTGGWCRPQNDGPSLRAVTLMLFAEQLIQNGQMSFVKQFLWTNDPNVYGGGIIKRDLDWVAGGGWASNTCDLWEEVQSTDFFWNRMAHNRALYHGANFAGTMGDAGSSQRYSSVQQQVAAALLSHWNGVTLIESTNRPLDGALLAALNDGVADDQPTPFSPTSEYVAGTIKTLTEAFCAEYPINNADSARGVPGTLIGRYPRDKYGGGNPWILLSNYLAQLLYRGAQEAARSNALPPRALLVWSKVLAPRHGDTRRGAARFATASEFAEELLAAGDGVLQRVRFHVAGAGFHLSEQLDKYTGFEKSAVDLTWSYATVLTALFRRDLASKAIVENQ